MTDIVDKLIEDEKSYRELAEVSYEARTIIQKLRDENQRLRLVLRDIGDYNNFGWTLQTEIALDALGNI